MARLRLCSCSMMCDAISFSETGSIHCLIRIACVAFWAKVSCTAVSHACNLWFVACDWACDFHSTGRFPNSSPDHTQSLHPKQTHVSAQKLGVKETQSIHQDCPTEHTCQMGQGSINVLWDFLRLTKKCLERGLFFVRVEPTGFSTLVPKRFAIVVLSSVGVRSSSVSKKKWSTLNIIILHTESTLSYLVVVLRIGFHHVPII